MREMYYIPRDTESHPIYRRTTGKSAIITPILTFVLFFTILVALESPYVFGIVTGVLASYIAYRLSR